MEQRSEEVVPGLWSLPIALQAGGLGRVFCYALRLDDGVVLIDAGWWSRASLASLEERLAEAGAVVEDVRGVLFTHAHGDHYGLAGAVRERSGAWLAVHPAEVIHGGAYRRPGFLRALSAEVGLDLGEPGDADAYGPELPVPDPDRQLADGDVVEAGRWRLRVVHTPGHSPGHVCFVVEGAGIVLLGDHVLSRTTPHVSYWPGTEGDPLGDYLDSLRRIARVGDGSLGLPGHEERIEDIPRRAMEILEHHDAQFAAVTDLIGDGHDTIGAVAERMSWARRWPELGRMGRLLAVGEASAHLRALEKRGQILRLAGSPLRFVGA